MTIELIQVETKLVRRADETKTVTVTGESTSSPYFAITPSIRHDDEGMHFGWGKSVTHIPSGLTLPTGEADHRMVVDAVADLIDWSSATPLADPVDRKLVIGVVRKLIDDAYEANPWPEWAGDATKPALSLLVTQLDDGIENYDKRGDDRNELVGKVAAFDAALARKIGGYLDAGRIGIQVQSYGTAWLLAVLMQLDPEVADQAARGLVSAWEDGGVLDEHIYEWRNAIANGRPPRLYGITFPSPSLDLGDVK